MKTSELVGLRGSRRPPATGQGRIGLGVLDAITSMNDTGLPLLLTVDEAAVLLRTTRTAVYAMVARGQLPGITRIGRRLLIRSDDLLHWLDQNRAPSPKE